MDVLTVIAIIVFLIAMNGLYVAGEFATISARRSRLLQMLEEKDSKSLELLLPYVSDVHLLDRYVAACQIGITISSLLLGFYGQANLTEMLTPALTQFDALAGPVASSISAIVVLALLTTLQVVLGELVPKNIGVQYPERLALLTVQFVHWSLTFFRPLIWIFNGSGHFILRLLGVQATSEHVHLHAPEEIAILVEQSGAGGLLESEERVLVENTLRLQELAVRQVMIPRTRMLAGSIDTSTDELLAMLATSPYSRCPLYNESVDQIVGVVHLKDLLCLDVQGHQSDASSILRPAFFVFENVPAVKVLSSLQQAHESVAIVLDEYGGTAGIVALEDLIEEIFGELQDEFDIEAPLLQVVSNNRVRVRGDVLIADLNEWLGLALDSEEVDTIGGLIFSSSGQVPEENREYDVQGAPMRVERMDGKGISIISLAVSPEKAQQLREERFAWI